MSVFKKILLNWYLSLNRELLNWDPTVQLDLDLTLQHLVSLENIVKLRFIVKLRLMYNSLYITSVFKKIQWDLNLTILDLTINLDLRVFPWVPKSMDC